MKSLNKVFLMGHLGGTPELMTSKNGKPYTRLRVATDRFMGLDAEGKAERKADWHSVFVWGDQATRCVQNLRQGALIFVEGSLSYWQVAEDRDPSARGYKNAIQADRVRFLSAGKAVDSLDNSEAPINHNAVAHPLM